jgi:hypothetical protein
MRNLNYQIYFNMKRSEIQQTIFDIFLYMHENLTDTLIVAGPEISLEPHPHTHPNVRSTEDRPTP